MPPYVEGGKIGVPAVGMYTIMNSIAGFIR